MGMEGRILGKVSEANIEIDMIAQNATARRYSRLYFHGTVAENILRH